MKHKKVFIILPVVLIAVAGAVVLYVLFSGDTIAPGRTGGEKQTRQGDITTAKAQVEQVPQWYHAVGTVKPSTQARIEARIPGQVLDVRVHAGNAVSAGDVIVTLDDRQFQARVSQALQSLEAASSRKEQALQGVSAAKAAFTEAESAYNRIKKFFDVEAATEAQLEQVRSRYLQAEAALTRAQRGVEGAAAGVRMAEEMVDEAKVALSYTKLSAPSDGEVLKRLVDPGDMAMPGKPLLLLRTPGGLRLEANVRESLVGSVSVGSTVTITLPTLNQTVEGVVKELVPYADPQSRTFLVKVKLPDTEGVYPGMYGKILLHCQEIDLVMIPERAVAKVGQMELVMVETEEGWARRYIKTGEVHGDMVEVLSGLSGGETLKVEKRGDHD